jgi:hypothetical protein
MMRDWNSITYDRYVDDQKLDTPVGHGMLDISRDIPDEFVRKRTFDMTFWMTNQCLKMGFGKYRGYSESVKEILSNSIDSGDEICIIQAQGMMSLRLAHIVTLSIKYFKENPDKFVLGHIMAKENRYPGLHRQMLIVNLKVWDKLDRPEYLENGFFWDRKPAYQNYIVSENKVAAEYTPEYIKSNDGLVYPSYTEDGANWIDLALKNNIQIDNLSLEMRECKCFIYPYEESEQISKVWQNLQDEIEVDKLSNYSTKAWMRKLAYQEFIEKDRVYAFNTERLSAEGVRTNAPVDNLFCAAAGFKPLALLRNNQFHKNTTVHYFDWCESSLNFKKHLVETWDGLDFDKWLLDNDLKYNFSSTYRGNYSEFWELEINKEFNNKEEFKELWDRYKLLKHEFHVIDIVNEPEKLFNIINQSAGVNVLWTTNIWASLQLHWNIEPEVLEQKYLKFESLIPKDLALYGQDYMARDLRDRIKNNLQTTHPRYSTKNKYINMGI